LLFSKVELYFLNIYKMNSNNIDLNVSSSFKFEDAKKKFQKLNNCNSDNDCPGESYCIGNKCIVNFYCRKDESACATSCNGNSCSKETENCEKNGDCFLNGVCNEYGFCGSGYFESDHYNVYSLGFFTYKDAKNYFDKMNIPCGGDKKCPKYTKCEWHYDKLHPNIGVGLACRGQFYCNKDKTICSFNRVLKDGISMGHKYKCNSNDECISGYCKNNECKNVYLSEISEFDNKYGLVNGERCWRNKDCLTNHCIKNNVFFGFCKEPSDSDGVYLIEAMLRVIIAIIIISFIRCCLCITGRNKRKALKLLHLIFTTIILIIISVIVMFYFNFLFV